MEPDCNESEHGQLNFVDRVSDLPELIMHHIISFLGFKEASRTCILSKRWAHISNANPVLELYHGVNLKNQRYDRVKIDSFLEYVETRMQKYSKDNLRITKLILEFPIIDIKFPNTNEELAKKVDEWVEIAVRNQVEEVILSGPKHYRLPNVLLAAKSLKRLLCSFVMIPHYKNTALNLVSLETLFLHRVVLDDTTVNHITSSCLLLKKLILSYCYLGIIKNIVIPCCSKLETLEVCETLRKDGTIILQTSTLTFFKFYSYLYWGKWLADNSKDGLLRNLRILQIGFASIADDFFGELLSRLTLLETLKLCQIHMLSTIRVSSSMLKEIRLSHCASLMDVKIDAPCLKMFTYKGDFELPLSIVINSQAPCDITIYIPHFYFFYPQSFIKVKELLVGLSNCNILKILLLDDNERPDQNNCDDIDFGEEDLADTHLGPPCDVRELKLFLSSWILSESSVSAFLRGLFWICHPSIISLRVNLSAPNVSIERMIRKLKDIAKSWRHPLKRIEAEGANCSSVLEMREFDVQLRLYW